MIKIITKKIIIKEIRIKILKLYIIIINLIKILNNYLYNKMRIALIFKKCFNMLYSKIWHHSEDSASDCQG